MTEHSIADAAAANIRELKRVQRGPKTAQEGPIIYIYLYIYMSIYTYIYIYTHVDLLMYKHIYVYIRETNVI